MVELTAIESAIWKDLDKLTINELEDMVGTHFSFNENASEDLIKHFHARQRVAQNIIDRRKGRLKGRDPTHVWRDKSKDPSIWSIPYSSSENST